MAPGRHGRLFGQKQIKGKKLHAGSISCSPGTITWKLERNANSRAAPHNRESLGPGLGSLCFPGAPRDPCAHAAPSTPATGPTGRATKVATEAGLMFEGEEG